MAAVKTIGMVRVDDVGRAVARALDSIAYGMPEDMSVVAAANRFHVDPAEVADAIETAQHGRPKYLQVRRRA